MNPTQLPLSPDELKNLKDSNKGTLVGIAVLMALTTWFSFLFGFDIHFETTDTARQIFSTTPFLVGLGYSFFLGREVWRTSKDIRGGYKLVLSGVVTRRFTSILRRSNNNPSTSERIRHFIVVNDEKIYVEYTIYNQVREGQHITYHLTPHGREVMEVISDAV